MKEHRLETSNMSRSFPGVKALDNIKLTVKPGSVHALIGENEAGKSTLMKRLFGLYHPGSRTIEIDGQVMDTEDPSDALKSDISMIHRKLNPVPCRNVADNIWTGRFQTRGIMVDENQMVEKTRNLSRDLGFDMDMTTFAKNLSVSQMRVIEMVKAVPYNAEIIIMDGPTSSLTMAETQHLFKVIGKLRREGRSIIYISRKLEGIFGMADEITVMRDGQYIDTWDIKDITVDQLIGQVVGRKIDERFPMYGDVRADEVMLRVENFTSTDPRSFKNISFDLHRGEILGIGGLVGTQRTELIEAISDLRKIADGRLTVNGRTVISHLPWGATRNEFAFLAEERRVMGIVPILSAWDNTPTITYKRLAGSVLGYIYTKRLFPSVDKMCTDLDVHMAGTRALIKNLSGGNQQKVLIGRRLLANYDVIVLGEPTRGADVSAKYEIYRIIQDLIKKGKAIIVVSFEIPELLGMSDRIIIICVGKQIGILGKKEAIQIEVMRYATQFDNRTEEGVSV